MTRSVFQPCSHLTGADDELRSINCFGCINPGPLEKKDANTKSASTPANSKLLSMPGVALPFLRRNCCDLIFFIRSPSLPDAYLRPTPKASATRLM